MKKLLLLLTLCVLTLFLCPAAQAAKYWYVDSAATGLNNGTSWANAWTKMSQITGLSAGDTVYFSGGPSGSSRTYPSDVWSPNYPGQWQPKGGSAGSPITYTVGQEASHNGTVIFDCLNGDYFLAWGLSHLVVSGDAGDGVPHFRVINCGEGAYAGNGGYTDVRFAYIDFEVGTSGIDFQGTSYQVEVDHCIFNVMSPNADHCMTAVFSGADYDTSAKIHDNTIYVPNGPVNSYGGNGADAFQASGSGFSFYNNLVVGYWTNFTGNQHQDGWQGLGPGQYIKIYGNTFVNMANYAVFPEPYTGGFTNMLIYNNVMMLQGPNIVPGTTLQALVVAGDPTKPATNVHVFNNTVVDYQNSYGIAFRNPYTNNSANTFFNCSAENNVFINSPGSIIDPNVSTKANVFITSGSASANVLSYTALAGTNNNLHLKAGSSLIDAGISMAAYATTDKDGVIRPQGSAWDIGAYEYASTILYGDVSGDGSVTAYDAALAAAGSTKPEAEVSGGGGVTNLDAALIAQRAVGLISKFPVEG